MPDKNYSKCYVHETGCLRCWRNKLKHGSKQAKAYVIKHGLSLNFDIDGQCAADLQWEQYTEQRKKDEVKKVKLNEQKARHLEKKLDRKLIDEESPSKRAQIERKLKRLRLTSTCL